MRYMFESFFGDALLYKSLGLLNVLSSADKLLVFFRYIACNIFNYSWRMARKKILILLNRRGFLEGIMVLVYESLISAKALERVDCLAKSSSFIFLKDHKPNFSSNPKCRLINTAKCEIWKISKYFLGHLKSKVRGFSSVNQWQKTSTVINWFRNIKYLKKWLLVQFGIEELYPSISKKLFTESSNIRVNFSKYQLWRK